MTRSIEKINKNMLLHVHVNVTKATARTNNFLLIFYGYGHIISTSATLPLHCARSYHSTGIPPYILVDFMSNFICTKKCQHNNAFACKETLNLEFPGHCIRWLIFTLPTKFSFSWKIIQLLSMGGCYKFWLAHFWCPPYYVHHHVPYAPPSLPLPHEMEGNGGVIPEQASIFAV